MNTKPSYAELENRIKALEQAESERKMVENALRASEEKYRDLFENAVEGIFQTTLDGRFISANPSLIKTLGFSSFHDLSRLFGNIRQQHYLNPEDRDHFTRIMENQGAVKGFETQLLKKDGTPIWASLNARAVKDDEGNVLYFEGIVKDITQRRQAEQTMRLAHFGVNHSRDAIFWLDAQTRLIYVNDAACRSLGYSREELLTMTVFDIDPDFSPATWKEHLSILREKGATTHESRHRARDGRTFPVEITGNYVNFEGAEGSFAFVRDISSRKQAAEEQEKLHRQLIQAQKMESIGILAGGIAHDFNNMLGVILGHAEMALKHTGLPDLLTHHLEQIRDAATHSTEITRQLLAYARKQTIQPKTLDLNSVVADMLKMLSRLMGEDIHLLWKPAGHLAPVNIDPGQVDQILANLCVNARDAIRDVGKLTIETGMKTFDQAYCDSHNGFVPGRFVMLAVSDDGCGMDKKVLPQIFDPFYTTKKPGRGTGLGLSTVYGIVKQNNGFVNVYSEPGQGTTFKIYLPCHHAGTPETIPPKKSGEIPGGQGETILVVEDEDTILEMIQAMLEKMNYVVLAAATPDQALAFARNRNIHLMITDVVMPGMNGRDLADKMKELIPDAKVLFMSGYTANVIAHHGVLDEGIRFIQKPFSLAEIARMVRDVLGE
jgi:two-component system, cell cycle sensor histidine kinase and response regulator CckA